MTFKLTVWAAHVGIQLKDHFYPVKQVQDYIYIKHIQISLWLGKLYFIYCIVLNWTGWIITEHTSDSNLKQLPRFTMDNKNGHRMQRNTFFVSVCFAVLLSCTLRLYIRCYHWYKPGQVREQIGLIHPLPWEPISGKNQTDLAFCWRPWGAAPSGSDPFLKG